MVLRVAPILRRGSLAARRAPATLARTLADERAGACVTFEGWVRNRNEGQPVLSLEYEAYALLADKEGARILAEARKYRLNLSLW